MVPSTSRPASRIGHARHVGLAVLAAVSASITSHAMAAEYGTVVSSTPIAAQIPVPQSQCADEQQIVSQRNTGGGALVGALIGGALGNSMGAGFGRAAATGLGIVAGAAVGDNIEAANSPSVATTVRRCNTVTRYENRVIGYDVTYDYNGRRYVTRTAQPPGERIALNVTVAPADAAPLQAPQPVAAVQPVTTVIETPAPVYVYRNAYPYPASYGYVYGGPAVVVAPRAFVGGGYYGPHRHWR
jgi:uncharacterized protein YcfJ